MAIDSAAVRCRIGRSASSTVVLRVGHAARSMGASIAPCQRCGECLTPRSGSCTYLDHHAQLLIEPHLSAGAARPHRQLARQMRYWRCLTLARPSLLALLAARAPLVQLALVVVGGCAFEGGAPPNAFITCAVDDECPIGDVCNAPQARCVPSGADVTPPRIARYAFEPGIVNGGDVRLVIEADEPLAADVPALETTDTLLPALAALGPDGTSFVFVVDADALTEGAYAVRAVTVRDLAGNVAVHRAADVALVVDRTAPALANVARVAEPALGYSDRAGTGTSLLALQLIANEPLVEATLALGTALSSCAPADAERLWYRCEVELADANAVDGANTAELRAPDAAGNVATLTLSGISVDAAAPAPVDGTVDVVVSAPGGVLGGAAAAAAGGVVAVSFVVSEALGAASAAVVTEQGDLPFVVTTDGRTVDARLDVPFGVTPGAYPLRAVLEDVFGHVASLELALPAPFVANTIPFAADVGSECLHPSVSCVDADGDGRFAPVDCAGGNDCNDLDPTTFAGAPEIPGDGIANDCAGGPDVPIDDDSGVFVDPQSGVAANAGTRAAPVGDISRALSLLDGARRYIFLATGSLSGNELASAGVALAGVVGGLDPLAGWSRGGGAATTELGCDSSGCAVHGPLLDGVRLTSGTTDEFIVDDSVVARSVFTMGAVLQQDCVLFDVTAERGVRSAPGADVAIVESALFHNGSISPASVSADGRMRLHRVFAEGSLHVNNGGRVDVTSSIFLDLIGDAVVRANGGGTAALFHTTVVRDSASGNALIDVGAGNVVVAASILESLDGESVVALGAASSVTLVSNAIIFRASGTPEPFAVDVYGAFWPTVADFEAAPAPGSTASQNFVAAPISFESSFCPSPASDVRDAGVVPFAGGATTSVMIDYFGDCRYDGIADVGADELVSGQVACVVP